MDHIGRPRRGNPLSLESQKIADYHAERCGISKPTERECVDALVGVLLRSRLFDRDELLQHSDRYFFADSAGQVEIREAALEVLRDYKEEYDLHVYGEKRLKRMREPNMRPNLFAFVHGEGPFWDYGYKVQEEDYPYIWSWKTQILAQAKGLQMALQGSTVDAPYARLAKRVLGEAPDERDVIRFSLAIFIIKKQTPWHPVISPLRGIILRIFGGRRTLRDFGKRFDLCADAMLVARVLADELGFYSEIRNTSLDPDARIKKGCHQYLIYEDGVIFDPDVAPRMAGYIKNPQQYKDVVHESDQDFFFC